METVILWFWSPYATANKSLSLKPEAEKIPHLRMDLPAQHFQMRWCSTTSNNWSTSAAAESYDLGLAEKDCAWHSPLMTFAQLKALKNMRIRSQQSEDRRRERWGGLNEKYKEKREDSRAERRERHDSVPPLRRDTFKNVGERPVVSEAEILQRAFHSRLRRLWEHQLHHRKLHQHLRQKHVTRLHQHQLPLQMSHHRSKRLQFDRAARSPSNDPLVPSRTVGTSANTPPWRLRERGRERSQTPVERNILAHALTPGQIGVTEADHTTFLSRQRLHPAWWARNGLTKVIREHHQAPQDTEIPVIHTIHHHTTEQIHNQAV